MKFKYKQIVDVFTGPLHYLWFSGVKNQGEYKEWYSDGTIWYRCWFVDSRLDGEYKEWTGNGDIRHHRIYKDNKVVKDYLK